MAKIHEMNMTEGSLLKKLISYAIPVMLSGMLQLLFNTVDVIVVGRFVGEEALAAVGACGSTINLFIGLFMGLSVGANVLVSRFYGAKRYDDMNETMHTSLFLAVIFGVLVAGVGFMLARPVLSLMKTPEKDGVLDAAVLYLRIYVAGAPVILLYNFGAACLRAVGDTERPLLFLSIGGVANVLLNLFFVLVVKIGVAGVAIGTVASNLLAGILVLRCLARNNGSLRLRKAELRIKKDKLFGILRIGLLSGLQGTMFSLSNMVVQSSINSFGHITMAGNTAASNLEGFVHNAMNSMHQATLSFTAQNLGAKKYDRVWKALGLSLIMVTVIGLVLGNAAYLLSPWLLQLYTDSPAAIEKGILRMQYLCMPYFMCGVMDVLVGALRGLGASFIPMIVTLTGCCVFRLIWIATVFSKYHTLESLYLVYPISWSITAITHFICFLIIFRRLRRHLTGLEQKKATVGHGKGKPLSAGKG
ncbi:MAG: MATE family efflux transporter [Lachnospiraceae bacterium]|nr:MATE family efflux transporter [Lachnospiraceae bacterium]